MNWIIDASMRLYFRVIEPVLSASRKRSRLQEFGFSGLANLPICHAIPGGHHASCTAVCASLLAFHGRSNSKFLTEKDMASGSWVRYRCVPTVIRLGRFQSFERYGEFVRQQSAGNIVREIKRARRRYYCRTIDRSSHGEDILDVESSLVFRTSGPVVSALVERFFGRREVLSGNKNENMGYTCPIHYELYWGVFIRSGEGQDPVAGDRLVGHARLRRMGNCIRVIEFMGHGDHLRDGAMKLLFDDMMGWILGRDETSVENLEFFHYGALEQGGLGLVDWKRRLGFEPVVFGNTDSAIT